MNSVRYYVALVVLLSVPPGLLLWFIIHPFASFWRRLGPVWTYSILVLPMVAMMFGLFLVRKPLLTVDFGTRYGLIAVGVLVMVGAFTIGIKRKKHLTFGILVGLPELSEQRYPGKLLTEGLYAKIRHPRYVEAFLGILSYALIANYLAPYVLVLLSIPIVFLIVALEERELRDRFGEEYEEYCRNVPRFLPKF
jgi:protein-S-isoprenylcysteine O-methyltransferase Ste14